MLGSQSPEVLKTSLHKCPKQFYWFLFLVFWTAMMLYLTAIIVFNYNYTPVYWRDTTCKAVDVQIVENKWPITANVQVQYPVTISRRAATATYTSTLQTCNSFSKQQSESCVENIFGSVNSTVLQNTCVYRTKDFTQVLLKTDAEASLTFALRIIIPIMVLSTLLIPLTGLFLFVVIRSAMTRPFKYGFKDTLELLFVTPKIKGYGMMNIQGLHLIPREYRAIVFNDFQENEVVEWSERRDFWEPLKRNKLRGVAWIVAIAVYLGLSLLLQLLAGSVAYVVLVFGGLLLGFFGIMDYSRNSTTWYIISNKRVMLLQNWWLFQTMIWQYTRNLESIEKIESNQDHSGDIHWGRMTIRGEASRASFWGVSNVDHVFALLQRCKAEESSSS